MNVMIVGLILVAAAFILMHVLRSDDRSPRDLRQRPRPGEPPRRPASEMDRFLQEMQRLRQPPPPAEPVEYRPEPPPRPVVVVPQPAPPRRPEPVRERPRIVAPPPPAQVILDVLPASTPAPAPAPVVTKAPVKVAPATAKMREMLSSPQALRSAILLQEVLGPPRCRRNLNGPRG